MRGELRRRWRWHRCHLVCGSWPGIVHPGDHLQVCGLRRRFRCSAPKARFHLPDHHLLPPLAALAPAIAALVVLGPRLRLHNRRDELEIVLVSGSAAVLLPDHRSGLPRNCDHASHTSSFVKHTTSHTTTNTSTNTSTNPSSHTTSHCKANPAHSPSSIGVQLRRGWHIFRVAASEAAVVLHSPPHLWAGDSAATSSRSL